MVVSPHTAGGRNRGSSCVIRIVIVCSGAKETLLMARSSEDDTIIDRVGG